MGVIFKRSTAMILSIVLLCQLLTGCGKNSDSNSSTGVVISEQIVSESHIYENTTYEEKLTEAYIVENLRFEEGIYEYQIEEEYFAEAYVIEMTVGELTEEEILARLPENIQDYDINWPKVVGKFAVGTAIIITVGVVNHATKGATYFVFGSTQEVAKDALVGGAIAATISVVAGTVENGKMPAKGVTKYAIEGFADGYMWGAIASVTKIAAEDFKRLQAFKTATGGKLAINALGQVFDDAGKLVGKAVYEGGKKGLWYLVDDASTVVQVFDKAGKAITDPAILSALKTLPRNALLRMGPAADAALCYTDDLGQIIRIGNDLLPNMQYTLNGYSYYTDDLGRISKVAFDNLQLKPEGQARRIIQDGKNIIGRGYEQVTDDRGHLIADMFNGDNSLANIVAQNSRVNQGDVKAIETAWKTCLEQGGKVSGTIEITYSSGSYRPDSFSYVYDMGKGMVTEVISNII